MKFKSLLFICLLFCFSISYSQNKVVKKTADGYEVTINTENLKGKRIELCLYYGLYNEKTIVDSVTIKSDNQKVVFAKTQKVYDAIYVLRIANQIGTIDLVIDDGEKLIINLNKPDITAIAIAKNQKNSDFLSYQKNISEKNSEESIAKRKILISKYSNSSLALYCKIQNKIATKITSNPAELKTFQNSFFSEIKTTDSRMFLMPNLYQFLFKYVSSFPVDNTNYQNSIKKILGDLKCTSNNYKAYAKWFLSNFLYYESFNLEESFLLFFKNYVDLKECNNFTDSELANYRNKSETIKVIPLNSKIPNLVVQDALGNEFNLYQNYPNYDYTYLAFYSPSCSHCNETMPKVQEYFEALQKINPQLKLQLIAVLNDEDTSLWQTFITEKKLQNWINVRAKGAIRDFQKEFNAYANPNFVLTNKEGIIILKSCNPKALNEVLKQQNK
jgi:thiol-disulfide isomerase/thioredoxin